MNLLDHWVPDKKWILRCTIWTYINDFWEITPVLDNDWNIEINPIVLKKLTTENTEIILSGHIVEPDTLSLINLWIANSTQKTAELVRKTLEQIHNSSIENAA